MFDDQQEVATSSLWNNHSMTEATHTVQISSLCSCSSLIISKPATLLVAERGYRPGRAQVPSACFCVNATLKPQRLGTAVTYSRSKTRPLQSYAGTPSDVRATRERERESDSSSDSSSSSRSSSSSSSSSSRSCSSGGSSSSKCLGPSPVFKFGGQPAQPLPGANLLCWRRLSVQLLRRTRFGILAS